MLRRDEGAEWLVIRQEEHAALSGRLAQQWAIIPNPIRDTLLAVYEHDNGHARFDANGHWNAESGEVQDFRSAPQATRDEIPRVSIARLAVEHPYAALLVAIHFGQEQAKDELLSRLRNDPTTATHATPEHIDASYALVQACDALSLAVCLNIENFGGTREVSSLRPPGQSLWDFAFDHRGADIVALDPWPFARREVAAHVTARVIAARRYASADALATAFHGATLRDITVRFVPA